MLAVSPLEPSPTRSRQLSGSQDCFLSATPGFAELLENISTTLVSFLLSSTLTLFPTLRADHQPVTEASYANIPIVALSNIDSPTKFIDIAVPCNNKSSNSIGLMWWMLAREVLS